MCVVEGDGEYQSDEEDDAGYSGEIVCSLPEKNIHKTSFFL
jgi:hypothetical protein